MFTPNNPTVAQIQNIHRVRRRLACGEYNTHYYHRHTRTKLPGRPGSPEFLAAYRSAEQQWANRTMRRGRILTTSA
jgi:hypothetical protein